jgi:hypothetical protein
METQSSFKIFKTHNVMSVFSPVAAPNAELHSYRRHIQRWIEKIPTGEVCLKVTTE